MVDQTVGVDTTGQYETVEHGKHSNNISYELGILCEIFVNMSCKIKNTIGLLKKIAEHRATNQLLKDNRDALVVSETRYRNLFNYMHNRCAYYKVLFDEAGDTVDLEYVDVNYPYEKYVGCLVSELIGKRLTEILTNTNEENFNWMKALTTVAISGEPVSFTQYSKYQERWFSISAYSPVKNHVAVISEDVTNNIILQREVARMDRLDLIGNMAAGLAHEIRNPMTVVAGYLQYF